ncbi:MAG TPA: HAD hydrolase family protein [Pyrinomonadaceae bacterium]|nr:HAD hydrolase family protein [Pyrinomonadaceae bacterium]
MISEVQKRAARIKLLLMDCDGVLTDGRVWLFENGEEQKGFHTRDGLGIDLLHRAGLRSGIISGRTSSAVQKRAQGLDMSFVIQGCEDKQKVFGEILARAGVENLEVAYIGDDLNDIPLILQSGLGVAVADAALETREHAHYVTNAAGGFGAVREVIELILKSQNRWDDLIASYIQPRIIAD